MIPPAQHLSIWIANPAKAPAGYYQRDVTPCIRELVSKNLHQTVVRFDVRYRDIALLNVCDFDTSASRISYAFRHLSLTTPESAHHARPCLALTLEPDHLPDAHFVNLHHILTNLTDSLASTTRRMAPHRMDYAYRQARQLIPMPRIYCRLYDLDPDPAWPDDGAEPADWITALGMGTNFARMIGRKLTYHLPKN